MRIALIALHFSEYSISLAQALAKKNDVLLILNERNFLNEIGSVNYIPDESRLTVEILPHYISAKLLVANAIKIVDLVRKFNPDVIHCQEEPKDYLIAALPFLREIPFVLTVHDPSPHVGLDSRRIKYSRRSMYIKLLRKCADAIIVHGDLMRRVAESHLSKRKEEIFNVPHGPLGKIFNPSVDQSWEAGNCLFFGRIHAYKGLGYFIDAIEMLRNRGIAVKGMIAGRGSEIPNYEHRIANNPAFILIDRYLTPTEVMACFQQANVVVMPYIEASQSGVSAYAIGVGRPVVATRVGGLPESVKHGETGLIVEPRNAQMLSDAIESIVLDKQKAISMSKNAFAWGESDLSWAVLADRSVAVYESAMS